MREIRLSGSEGGGTPVLPTPIVQSLLPACSKTHSCRAFTVVLLSVSRYQERPQRPDR
jgi:hypothetical protein